VAGKDFCRELNNLKKNIARSSGEMRTALGDLSQVIGELAFFDDEKASSVRLD